MKTIKDAYEALNGDLKNTRNQRSHEGEFLFINTDNGRYLTFNRGCHKDNFQYICTVEEFNNYKPEKTVHDAVIEFKGECFGSGFISHSKTRGWTPIASKHLPMSDCFEVCSLIAFNAYVDLLASNMGKDTQSYAEYKSEWEYVQEFKLKSKPVYTQEMADNGVLPSLGMMCLILYPSSNYLGAITYMGDGCGCFKETNGKEYSFAINSVTFKPITPPVTLIDGEAYKFDFDNGSNIIQHKKMAMYDERRRCMWIKGHTYSIESCANIKPLTVEDK